MIRRPCEALPCRREGAALPEDEVHVWRARLEQGPGGLERCWGHLCEQEQARAQAIRIEQKKREFVAGRGILREILASYTACAPEEIQFQYAHRGRPSLCPETHPAGVQFNVSHSVDLFLCAVVSGRAIGVDVERIAGIEGREGIARRFFHAEEYESIQALPDALRARGFFRCWVTKEAFLKAQGEGLHGRLNAFQVEVDPRMPPGLRAFPIGESNEWTFAGINAGEEYDAVCAVQGKDVQIHASDWIAGRKRLH